MDELSDLAGAVRVARSVVVLTGAGVSAESGVRTFRDTMEGLWKDFDPARLAGGLRGRPGDGDPLV